MNSRRGMGKGLGCGYKNIAPMDSHIHSLSAKGIKTLQKQLLQHEKKIKYFERKERSLDTKIRWVYEAEKKATKELEKKLANAHLPYIKKRNLFENKKSRAENNKYEAERKVKELANEIALVEAKTGKTQNVESVKALLRVINFGYHTPDRYVKEKTPLSNGIQIFKGSEDEPVRSGWGTEGNAGKQVWLAFDNGRLIGYSLRRASEHAGDSTSGVSFVGNERLTKMVTNRWGRTEKSDRIGFKDWVKKLQKENPKKLPTVNLKNKGEKLNDLYH